jgi:hypothetical protein
VGGGYDLFLSKNTLKRGYIHPARPTNPAWLIELGVSDEAFVKAVAGSLKPGGYFLIYNLTPPQAPPDKPFLPMADGRCPFPRAVLEANGFEVLAYDVDDSKAARALARALKWDVQEKMNPETDLFGLYTLARRR